MGPRAERVAFRKMRKANRHGFSCHNDGIEQCIH